jgi:cell fate (sporulation/competence/biofilm development) regulator YmcA (YheA/YmcA/DUF963 family)
MSEIELKINELMTLLSNEEAIKRYKSIEKALFTNDYVKNKIENFRKLQKRMAIYESKTQKIPLEIQERYELLFNELQDIPIYNEYITLQAELNDLIQLITNIIETEINKK